MKVMIFVKIFSPENSKNYTKFIDLSCTIKTITAIKIVYANNMLLFTPFNESILYNFETE